MTTTDTHNLSGRRADTRTIILGGGQAGLALSSCLTALGHDHVVVERGRVAERWRSERWDSLRLLSPNWMTRLPGWSYTGRDPDGFMSAGDLATFLTRYAASFDAPVREHTTVQRVARRGDGFVVGTDDGVLHGADVVIATGWCDRAAVPDLARHLAPGIRQIDPASYRRPSDVSTGGVLVVGASATGVQLAHELRASGRDVTLAVGRHSRMPRRYRGMDIFWWLDRLGSFDRTIDEVADEVAARHQPSLQVVGRLDHATVDLTTLQADGVRLVGRVTGADGARVGFGTDVPSTVAAADEQMASVLERIDRYIEHTGLTGEVLDPDPPAPVATALGPHSLDLRRAGIETVIWATGHRRRYDWLQLPVLDERGEIRQYRGVTPVPGAYVLGQRFQHFRNSNFIDGVGRDAQYVAAHIHDRHRRRRPSLPIRLGANEMR